MIRVLLILLAMTTSAMAQTSGCGSMCENPNPKPDSRTGAKARCLPQTDMTPWGECGKPWPKVAQVALQPKWDARGHSSWTPEELARVKRSQDAAAVDPYFHGYHNICLSTGQPADCDGWVCGTYGCVKPGR